MFCNPINLPDSHDSNVAFQMSGKEFSIIIFEELKNDSCPGFEDFLKIQFPSLRPSITEIWRWDMLKKGIKRGGFEKRARLKETASELDMRG